MKKSCSKVDRNLNQVIDAIKETNPQTTTLIDWTNGSSDLTEASLTKNTDARPHSSNSFNCQNEEFFKKLPVIKLEPGDMFVVPLQSIFQNTSPSFGALSFPDMLISELLQSIPFIDVHLAVVVQRVAGEMTQTDLLIDWKDENFNAQTFWVQKWIHGRNSIPHYFELKLDIKDQLLGECKTILKKELYVDKETKEQFTEYHHAVFIIQPRHSSIRLGCHYDFQNIINHMWSLAESMHEKSTYHREITRQHLISTLDQVLMFCRNEPYRAFSTFWNAYEIPAPARRLMELCTVLRAKKEGLELLSILGEDFQLNLDNVDNPGWNEGISDTSISRAIADFQCQVCGNYFNSNCFPLI